MKCFSVDRSSNHYYDVLIVGGGIMGSSTAHWLASRNRALRVGVIEPDPSYQTSATTLSVGGLRQQFSLWENIEIGKYARDFMRDFPHSMFGDLDISQSSLPEVKFQPHGYLFLASESGYDILKGNHDTQVSCGTNIKLMTARELRETFPWLLTDGVVAGCYGGKDEGWFDPWALLQAFKTSAVMRGVEFITGRAVSFTRREGGVLREAKVRLEEGGERELQFDKVVLCAGGDSGQVGQLMGLSVPVEKRKRFVYVPHCPGGPGLDCPLVIDPTGVYFRREGLGGNYLCGQSPTADQEPPDTDLAKVDMDWFDEQVWPILAQRVKAFESLKVRSAWAGNYDYNHWDENGIIGQHPTESNVYMACGFSGHGIQQVDKVKSPQIIIKTLQGPAVGRAISELILEGRYKSIDLTRLGYQRILDGDKMLERYCV